MKKVKIFLLVSISILCLPSVTKADVNIKEIDEEMSEMVNGNIVPFSLANVSVNISRSGATYRGSVNIRSGNVSSSNLILQKRNGTTWSDYRILSSTKERSYSKSTTVGARGQYRFKLRCNIGSKVENHYSGSLTY